MKTTTDVSATEKPRVRRPYEPPRISEYFDPEVLIVANLYAGAVCGVAPPKMPPK